MNATFRLALPVLLTLSASAAAAEHADLMIQHATIVDVEHGRTIPGQSVVVRGEDIVAVGEDRAIAREWTASRVGRDSCKNGPKVS